MAPEIASHRETQNEPPLTLGSLFDGIGVFPLAASRHGIVPLWASEIEKAPVSITRRHFPEMEHLGDITKMDGGQIPAVHILTFGSPCQNLSQIGDRSGLAGAKSSLFHHAIRIIKEMRCATGGQFPIIALWENVPYALQRIRYIMNRNQLCVVPPKSSETEQKSPVSLHIIFGFSQARTATQSTPYPVPNEMPLEDQDELSLSPKQLAWPRYLLWRRPQW